MGTAATDTEKPAHIVEDGLVSTLAVSVPPATTLRIKWGKTTSVGTVVVVISVKRWIERLWRLLAEIRK